jgi:hypothetical protein
MSEPRLRLQHFIVQPVLSWDDGEDLTPGPVVQPQSLSYAGLRELVEGWPEKLAQLQAQAAAELGTDGSDPPPQQ